MSPDSESRVAEPVSEHSGIGEPDDRIAARELSGITGSRTLAWNTVLNLVGQGAPMLVALVAIPLLIQGLGTERFGVLTLAWMAIGYFSLFDLGMSRAVTHLVADKFGKGEEEDIPVVVWTALAAMAILGCVGGLALALVSPLLVTRVLNIPPELQTESRQAFYLIAFAIPWVVNTAGLRGVLEARQRFDLVNMIRVPMGVFAFLGPLLVLPLSTSLAAIVLVLMTGRIIAWLIHLLLVFRALPVLRSSIRASWEVVPPLLRFGSWLTVSNVVSPLMDGLDRFIVGAILSMNAVAYYVTPYEVVTKLWIVTAALLGVLFPAFAASSNIDRERTALLFDRGIRFIFLIVFPVALLLVTLSGEGLSLWLGAEFAANSTRVMQWLAIGVFTNMIGQVAYTLIQGVGRPDVTGKLHLAELPLYLGAMWWLLPRFGVEGAAIAWAARAALDAAILLVVAGRLLPGGAVIVRRTAFMLAGAITLMLISSGITGLSMRLVYVAGVLALFAFIGWARLLTVSEKGFLLAFADRGAGTS